MKKLAFTLAEIIIVVGIMGIIAESTIPSLISNASNKAYKAALKKNVSVYTSALRLVAIDNGGEIQENRGGADITAFLASLAEKLNVTKSCTDGKVLNFCWHDDGVISGGESINSGYYYASNNYAGYILNDGSLLTVAENTKTEYSGAMGLCSGTSPNSNCLFDLLIDTNGFKAPNKAGQDIIILGITRNGSATPTSFFVEQLSPVSMDSPTCSSLGVGFGCEKDIMLNK